ncbi:hypothetical protein P9094_05765 [Gallibacterium anatis]
MTVKVCDGETVNSVKVKVDNREKDATDIGSTTWAYAHLFRQTQKCR